MYTDELDSSTSSKAAILVATTIVENGIDIPNANTILIDRADRFGMADLYQMRGRVGRWNRRAYAYFLVPRARELPELKDTSPCSSRILRLWRGHETSDARFGNARRRRYSRH